MVVPTSVTTIVSAGPSTVRVGLKVPSATFPQSGRARKPAITYAT